MSALQDEHPGVQQAAIDGLVQVGGPAVVARLVGLLRAPAAIRTMAVEVLQQLLPTALDAALPLVTAPDPHVRKLVVDAVGHQPDPRVVGPLVARLEDPNPNVRAAAAEALGRLRAVEAVPALTARLQDEEWVVFSALTALAEIGDAAALPAVLPLVRDGRGAVRCAAIEAVAALDRTGAAGPVLLELAAAAEPDLRPALIKALATIPEDTGAALWAALDRSVWLTILTEASQDPSDEAVRLSAMTGLGRLGDPRGTRAVLAAYRRWARPSEEVEACAVRALVGTGDVATLLEAVRPEEEPVCALAVRALGELRAPQAVPALAAVRETSQNWELRRLAVAALAEIGTAEALDRVAEAVEDPTGHVRCEAVRRLGRAGRDADVRALFAKLTTERYQEVREAIVETLVRVAGPDRLADFVPLLAHPAPAVREAAARAIGLARLPEGLEPLRDAMNDPEWTVRQAAAAALGRFDDARAFRPLFLALADDHEQVRLAAVAGLARWDCAETRQALMTQSLSDTDAWVRFRAIERLGALGATEAAPLLARIAASAREPAWLRRGAVAALGAIGGEQARARLAELCQHERPDVREAAAAVLARDGWAAGLGE